MALPAPIDPRLVAQPPRGAWNRCFHSVCYVVGEANGRKVERIYHAGRSAETVLSRTAPYRIGYLERSGDQWLVPTEPLPIEGLIGPVGVLEPKVEYRDGWWQMRYLALTEPGDDSDGRHTILATRSRDGVTDWSDPVVLADDRHGFFDTICVPWTNSGPSAHLMVLTRSADLDGHTGNVRRGIWWSLAGEYSRESAVWSRPRLLLDASAGARWYAKGICSPSPVFQDADQRRLELLFAGVAATQAWPAMTLAALRRRRMPPVPSPLYFTIGRASIAFESAAA